jgi:hypothetical protein
MTTFSTPHPFSLSLKSLPPLMHLFSPIPSTPSLFFSPAFNLNIFKVGLRGMAGNKGGIAVHLVFHNTSLCFVTAHLAAGQSNVDERNADFNEITEQSAFGRQRNVKIQDHQYAYVLRVILRIVQFCSNICSFKLCVLVW